MSRELAAPRRDADIALTSTQKASAGAGLWTRIEPALLARARGRELDRSDDSPDRTRHHDPRHGDESQQWRAG